MHFTSSGAVPVPAAAAGAPQFSQFSAPAPTAHLVAPLLATPKATPVTAPLVIPKEEGPKAQKKGVRDAGLVLSARTEVPLSAGPFSVQLRPEYRLTWQIEGGAINVTMSTNSSGWLGFGLSPTAFLTFHGMNNADIVTACKRNE